MQDSVAVVGWSCRLPGAASIAQLWFLLVEGRCTVTTVPADRFPLDRFGHPRPLERGKSYTWAAGVLNDIWGFDPTVFGISPREAEQMDPQQRILLELVWEALEDAGIPPSTLGGRDVGVFIGASQTDYAHTMFSDYAVADGHFATGNALAVLANRISYAFDLRGPSIALDTACSSSLVALNHAVNALRSGHIDTALVGGINVIASPAEFISFSQAQMLSPTGLCHAFSADADGYVRAEGGIVLVLRRATTAVASGDSIHGVILASDVNSDGRTNGISLPSGAAQKALLDRVYARSGIDPDDLAFVEAHGTGTPVGDPIEAEALGRSLGRARETPLPIGSIKTNIGHVEAASGLAGLLKAMLALKRRVLPPSLHFRQPNPAIAFDDLNLKVCIEPLALPKTGQCLAGINSFGFGGTNAHVVIQGPPPDPKFTKWVPARNGSLLALSAATKPGLVMLAQHYVDRLADADDHEMAKVASAAAYHRDHLAQRLVVTGSSSQEAKEGLAAFVSGLEHPWVVAGTALGRNLPIGFVYSGNGSQWAGMGTLAYRHSAPFRARFDEVDAHFSAIAGWSLKEALFDDSLRERLPFTSLTQPLIFAIQCAVTAVLRGAGVHPSAVAGHSVGEVAAAEAAEALDLGSAVKVIYFRSKHQEMVRGAGGMAVVQSSQDQIADLIGNVSGIEIAAINSQRATTVAGPQESLQELKSMANNRGIAMLDLNLKYPFHTAMMAPIEGPLTADLCDIVPHRATIPFVSTVTGSSLPGTRLDAGYWWQNVRHPVLFAAAIAQMAALGVRFFVEIGPRGTLLRHISDNLAGGSEEPAVVAAIERNDTDGDFARRVVAKAYSSGAQLNLAEVFGPDTGAAVSLPRYPWQRREFRFAPTSEAFGTLEEKRRPFSGTRLHRDALVWQSHIDTALFPELADHRVGDQPIFPGTGFLEIAFAVGCEWLETTSIVLAGFQIVNPLDLSEGGTRTVMTRISPDSNTFEIFSRPRLSDTQWLLHCRGKMFHGAVSPTSPNMAGAVASQLLSGDEIYALASRCGLQYGPAFRLLDRVSVLGSDLLAVDLGPISGRAANFILDPVRIDACCHGLLTVFPELRAAERGVSYLPVRVGEATLSSVGAVPQRALITLLRRSERSIAANYDFFDEHDRLIASFRDVHCQAVQIRRPVSLGMSTFVELPQLADGRLFGDRGLALDVDEIIDSGERRGVITHAVEPVAEAGLLIEGWALAAAYELALGLAHDSVIDLEVLTGNGRVPQQLSPWIKDLLLNLEAARLVKREQAHWVAVADSLLPSAASLVGDLTREHPECAAEILIAGAISGFIDRVAQDHAVTISPDAILAPAVFDFYDAAAVSLKESGDVILRLLEDQRFWPEHRSIRVLQIGYGPLTKALLELQRRKDLVLTVVESDRRRRDAAARGTAGDDGINLIAPDELAILGTFDVIVSVESLHRFPAATIQGSLHRALAPRGVLLAVERSRSAFCSMLSGLNPDILAENLPDATNRRLQPPFDWVATLEEIGFGDVQSRSIKCRYGSSSLIVAQAGGAMEHPDPHAAFGDPSRQRRSVTILAEPGPERQIATMLAQNLVSRDINAAVSARGDAFGPAGDVVQILGAADPPADAMVRLTDRCLAIKTCAEGLGPKPATVWHVHWGALTSEAGQIDPIAAGTWAFTRTVANEFPHLDMRRIDVAARMPAKLIADRLGDIICSDTAESELQIAADATRAVRVERLQNVLDRKPRPLASAIQLRRGVGPYQKFEWHAIERATPGPGEVEIAVEATGLNFRDLMWLLSLLPDEILEDGFAGPTLGCECAGRIVRVGSGVTGVAIGDRVAAFASSGFATHVVVPATCVAVLPAEIGYEAGATIPVAFLTAYYSLITLARLQRGEWVLIHGGAGGVGLAAIQIARAHGAHIIATAGTEAKRDLLRTLGVDCVLDSRSTAFADHVRARATAGVDVVLNSLAGEAMERSLDCLRPFGRFIEIGKRDYVSNTHVGLRPFRKNLSYFGVDIDQLIASQNNITKELFPRLMSKFADGVFTPLPHAAFEATELSDALSLMQHSRHIGKIVVRRPRTDLVNASTETFAVSSTGTHVITGGWGGLGLEAAKWLVDKGARYLALVGRSGAASAEATSALAEFAARGVAVYAEPCDIGDRHAATHLFEQLARTMPPVVGVLHAAMVLDDGLIANLDRERFYRVLAPKVLGAENLDRLTRGMALDYFVLFSSATTLMGNPGQGNYVAANAYMEGLARKRRGEGLKALAVGWGPITDVGVLARSARLRSRFRKLTGIHGLRAADAIELLARALEQPETADLAVMTISPIEGLFPADRLPVLSSPTYGAVVGSVQRDAERGTTPVDLYEITATKGIEAARRALGDIIVVQLARILRVGEEEISRLRPLGEIGVDSLMAVEVAMNLEESFGIHMTLSSSIGTLTVTSLAGKIVSELDLESAAIPSMVTALAERHAETIDAAHIAALEQIAVEAVGRRSALS